MTNVAFNTRERISPHQEVPHDQHLAIGCRQKQLRAVIDRAATGQAQIITTQGAPTAVVLSYAEYQRLTAPALALFEFFQTCPLDADEELDITRDRSGLRPDVSW